VAAYSRGEFDLQSGHELGHTSGLGRSSPIIPVAGRREADRPLPFCAVQPILAATPPLPIATDDRPHDPEPSELHGPAPRWSVLSWLHPLRSWSLRQTRGDHASQWAAIVSIAAKIGCTAQTLRTWVVQAERDQGRRAGSTTDERERIKRWNARTASFARPMRFCARPQRILPRRSSTAGSGHDRLH
jgi:hypothetical protein